jgi:hypothetical protein
VIKLIISINDTCVWGKIKLIIAREALEQLIFCKGMETSMPRECKIVVDCWRQRDKAINYSENKRVNKDKLNSI